MKIERVIPRPPVEITMTFALSDGWAIVAALKEYVDNHPDAAHREVWLQWANDLDRMLRR